MTMASTATLLSPASAASENDLKVVEDETLLSYDLNTIMEGLGVSGDEWKRKGEEQDSIAQEKKQRREDDRGGEEEDDDDDSSYTANSYSQTGSSVMGGSQLTNEEGSVFMSPTDATSPHMYKNVATLYHLMKKQEWDQVNDVLEMDDRAASTWYYGTGDRGKESDEDDDSDYDRSSDDDQTQELTMWKRLPLHNACRWGAPLSVVGLLLDQFSDATLCVDPYSGTLPVHLACRYNASYYLTLDLLHYNGRIAAQQADNMGRLALHWACLAGNDAASIELLLQIHPAGILHKDRARVTPTNLDDDDDSLHAQHTPMDYALANPTLASDTKLIKKMRALYDAMYRVQERNDLDGTAEQKEDEEESAHGMPKSIIVATYDGDSDAPVPPTEHAGATDDDEDEEDIATDDSLDCFDGSRADMGDMSLNTADDDDYQDEFDTDERGGLTAATMMAVVGTSAAVTAAKSPNAAATPTASNATKTAFEVDDKKRDERMAEDDVKKKRSGTAAAVAATAATAAAVSSNQKAAEEDVVAPPSQSDIMHGVDEGSIDSFQLLGGDNKENGVKTATAAATPAARTNAREAAPEVAPLPPRKTKNVRQKTPRKVFYRTGGRVTSRMTGVSAQEAHMYRKAKVTKTRMRTSMDDSEEFEC